MTQEQPTVTATLHRRKMTDAIRVQRYRLTFSKLPDQEFGPYDFRDAREQLLIGALLERVEARALLLDAYASADGTATTATG